MQDASIAGTGHTVVQIVGDGNSVVADYPYLMLIRFVACRQIHRQLGFGRRRAIT
jgi:hypothetical protein